MSKKRALPASYNRLTLAIRSWYPNLSDRAASRLADQVLTRMSSYIDEGYYPAVARPNSDGDVDLVILSIENE